tara:strand:- start:60 stop:788 length:729 start_codon:yes stop_codon:yes gene_type:complete
MSSGGGKGGKNTTETEKDLPDWLKQPAIRNLQRAEDVQRIEYMPYRGAEIAAFNDTQNLAMNNNLATAKAFGLLDATSTMKAEDMMPTPTTFDGGFKGYSSMPLYDQALAETKKQQPGAIAQYEALFGAPAMAQLNASRSGGSGGGNVNFQIGGGNPSSGINANTLMASGSPNGRGYTPTNPNYVGGGGAARARQAQREALAATDHMRKNVNPREEAMKKAMSSYQPRTTNIYGGGNPHSGK